MQSSREIIEKMTAMGDGMQAAHLMRFFKTGKGEYGEGDRFLGLRVPQTRLVAHGGAALPLSEVSLLLCSVWHEIRLCGFLILVEKFSRLSARRLLHGAGSIAEREEIVRFYLDNARRADNWDLVDLSAPKIIGRWLTLPSLSTAAAKLETLDRLAGGGNLWEQRIAMVSTMTPTHGGDYSYALRYAEHFLGHSHDLMRKAVGWMLREVGKKDINVLRAFLASHHREMSRTTLRYAIERMPEEERRMWMEK